MGKWKKRSAWGQNKGDSEPLMAKVPLVLMLLNIFVCVGLRELDILLVSLASSVLALAGTVMAYKAKHRIRRKGGRIRGETMALIGYWGNLIIFLAATFLFAYVLAIGILRGDLQLI
jgi:hypothetical protein